MKIRIGFVSNSSTTSFCIYGYILSEKELKDLIDTYCKKQEDEKEETCNHKFNRKEFKFCPHCGATAYTIHEVEDYEYIEQLTDGDALPGEMLTLEHIGEGDYAIGTSVGENVTLEDLMKTRDELKRFFNKEAKFYSGEMEC